MRNKWIALVIAVGLLAGAARLGRTAELTAERVNGAIDRGVQFLRTQQNPQSGGWGELAGGAANQLGGVTSLCTLALLNAGLPADDPTIQAALDYLRKLGNPEATYSTSLQTMVFCLAEPEKDRLLIRRNVNWLEKAQHGAAGPGRNNLNEGGWDYRLPPGSTDESNSQFAVLALHEAGRVGIPANQATWQRALKYWLRRQDGGSGGWRYRQLGDVRGSMTCAGICSLAIINRNLGQGDAWVDDGRVVCCGLKEDDDALARALNWMAQHFSVARNPTSGPGSTGYHFYYLYSVERVGRLTGRRFIGQHDWYREGAALLCDRQDTLTGSWQGDRSAEQQREIATSFALLFLSKGRRPVVVSKLRRPDGNDWNRHRSDVENLTRYIEQRWERNLNWQIVDVGAATVDDLLQSPVLFISGRDDLQLLAEQKENLRQYVLNGGFIFAENCCEGRGFDQQFRRLMAELFPDSPLRLLPATHPVWYAEQRVDAEHLKPLYGIDACCRTAIVYCPEDLGCFWELARESSALLPLDVQKEIEACLAMGANVLAYATNRELRDKLDVPEAITQDSDVTEQQRGTLHVAKLDHGGGSDAAPAALRNMLRVFGEQLNTRVSARTQLLAPTDNALPDYPVAFMHGREDFRWNAAQREAIAQFVNNGGVIFADAICASAAFRDAFRREIEVALPDHPLRRIPPEHPLFTAEYRGFDLSQVRLRQVGARIDPDSPVETRVREITPVLEGVEINGRYAVIFSPYDISCALENYASLDCEGYVRQDAARLAVNVLLYALQQ